MWWWKQNVHSSWLVALASTGFVAGVVVSLIMRLPFAAGIGGICVVIIAIIIGRVYMLPVIACASVIIGVSYGSVHLGERSGYRYFIGQQVRVSGRIREDPSKSASGATSLQLDAVSINGMSMPGAVYLSVRSIHDVKRSDRVEAVGDASGGFGSFPISITATSLSRVVRPVSADLGRVVRDWFASKVRTVLPEPGASLGVGFLTGQKSDLPTELSDSLKVAGLTHIVVASGYNLTILVQLARKLFLKASKFLATMSSSTMIFAFMMVTGLSPSMTRAGLVSAMSLLAWYYGHSFHPIVLLPVAAALTVAFQPSYVWGDLGWQLSFAAFAGVMILAPLIQSYFFGNTEPSIIRQIFGETIAAHLVTIPVIAISFGVISNVAIVANILVVPLVPLAMLLTFLCGIGASISLPFIQVLATPTSWLLNYMVEVARFVSEIPWAQSKLTIPVIGWGLYGLILVGLCLWMRRATKYNFRTKNVSIPP